MAIEKMRLVSITSDKEHINEVLSRFCSLQNFHPEPASKFVDMVHGLTTLNDPNPYEETLTQIKDMATEMSQKLEFRDENVDENQLKVWLSELEKVHEKYKQALLVKKELEDVIQENNDAMIQMENIEDLGISLDDIFSCRYMKVRFGRLPLDSVGKLKYYNNKPFVFNSFNSDSVYSWCMYMTTPRYEGEVDNVFSSLYFERIRIPEFIHGEPGKAKEILQKEIEDDEYQLAHVKDVMNELVCESNEKLQKTYRVLCKLNMTFEARKYVVCLGERFSITGFVAKDDVNDVMEVYKDMNNVVEIEDRPPHSDKRLTPPTKLKNGWLTRPFSFFVEMYGVPEYEDFDPTPLVAISYILLFGIMFGDLGQGLLLSLVGFILYKRKGWALAAIAQRIGVSSAFFGLVYGSVFGNEEILNPLYEFIFHIKEKPVEVLDASFTMTLLMVAVAIGVVLICTCMILNTILHFRRRKMGEALFSHNGIAGIVFYISMIIGVVAMLSGYSIFSLAYILLLIVLPLLLIFMKEPISHKLAHKELFPDGFVAFFMESFFELFEVLLSFISNTMSFLRVGGFVLSHAGMMLVVMTLAEMVGPNFGWFVIIFGNIFVMCMEGLIVGIQVLRLEFYEQFSRYFEGKGIPFQTMDLD